VNRRTWQSIRLVAGVLITLICLHWALSGIRVVGLVEAATQAQWRWLVVAAISLALGYFMRICRWWCMLRLYNHRIALRTCAWPLIVGVGVNNIVPFRAGDAVRILAFREQLGTPVAHILGSVIIERFLDVTVLFAFLLVGFTGLKGNQIPATYVQLAEVVGAVGALTWVALVLSGSRLEGYLLRVCRLRVLAARGWSATVECHLKQLFSALNIVRAPSQVVKLTAMSVLVWTCEGSIFASVARSLRYGGGDLGPWLALATGSLSTLIPSSPGYVGTFDFSTVSAFTAYGASPTTAAATAIIVHAVLWLPLTVAGVTYLLGRRVYGQRKRAVTRPLEGRS